METKSQDEWNSEASAIVKSILQRKRVKISELAKMFADNGYNYSHQALINMLNRGTFKFSFVLQVMRLLEMNAIVIDEPTIEIRK